MCKPWNPKPLVSGFYGILKKLGDRQAFYGRPGYYSSQASYACMKFLCTCIVGPTKKEYTMRDNRIIPHYKTSLPSFHSGLQTTLRVRPVRAPIAAKARAAAHTAPIAERGVLHTSHTMASYPEKDSCCFATEWLQGDGLRTHTHTHAVYHGVLCPCFPPYVRR